MKSLFGTAALAASVVVAAPLAAQQAEGYWTGTLVVGNTELAIGVGIERQADGSLAGTLDSPSQGAFGIPLADLSAEDGTLAFTVPSIGASYAGEWDAREGQWNGTFAQGGMQLPLALRSGERPERPAAQEAALPENWDIPADAELSRIIAERIAQRPGAGMVVGIVEPAGERVVAGGGSGFDADTMFEIGSMTKVFTSLLLADMVLDGKVSLDDPVAKFLPEGARMPGRGDLQITLRNLSQQDSGLPRLPDNLVMADISDPYVDYTESDLLAFLASYELPRDIGSQYEYSNLGVGLLGYVLARAEGTDYETLLRTRILEPVGMDDTAISLNADQQARLAVPHDGFGRPTSPWNLSVLAGAGGMRSTTADMQTFLRAALDPQSPIGDAMQLALSETREGPGFKAGLGWGIFPAPGGLVAAHGGGTGGFRTHMAVQPDTGRAVVVLTNSAVEPAARDIGLHALIGAPVAEAAPVPEAPAEVAREEVELTLEELERLTGTYRFAPNLALAITREGDQLFAAITGQGALPIFPRAPLEFFWRAVNAEIVFAEQDGTIVGATFTQDGNSSELTRVD
jgi:CubicO group peptidase (beta-lactamase class C family)